MNRLGLFAYALATSVVALDQAVKFWILEIFRLPERASAPVLGPLTLSMVWNRGVSFGMLTSDAPWTRWALTAFSLLAAGALAVWAWRIERVLLAIAVGLIMGGAVGNAIDRIRLGAVADFLDFKQLFFPWVFNVADSAITIGAALLLWDVFMAPRKGAPA